jgi:hypothetical protein
MYIARQVDVRRAPPRHATLTLSLRLTFVKVLLPWRDTKQHDGFSKDKVLAVLVTGDRAAHNPSPYNIIRLGLV